jgi:endonuclease/exonuclease/phosphatase family metal-dependent hydrolase
VGYTWGVRAATFNILHGARPGTEVVDPRRLGEAVARLDADLLGLQEVDHLQERSGHVDLTAVAAEAMGATHHRFVAALSGEAGTTWSAATGDEQPSTASYGVAFLSRHPVVRWRVVRLAASPVRLWHRFHGDPRPRLVVDEPRVAVAADVETPEGLLTVVTTHLSFLPAWNWLQLRRLLRTTVRPGTPTLVMGDLNMEPARVARLSSLRPLASAPTFPADRPTRQIDHLLGSPSVGGSSGRAVPLPLSDHLALVTEVSLSPEAA